MKLWSLDKGTLQATFRGRRGWSNSMSFSPDGKAMVTASDDGVLVLSLELDDLLEHSCDQVRDYLKNNRNFEKSDRTLCDGIGTQK